jgi:hypothetical protein
MAREKVPDSRLVTYDDSFGFDEDVSWFQWEYKFFGRFLSNMLNFSDSLFVT